MDPRANTMKRTQALTPVAIPDTIRIPHKGNAFLKLAIKKINQNQEVKTLWKVANVNAIDRLGFNDHGPVHVQIVANIALRLARILAKHDVEFSVVKDFQLTNDHAELIIVLASLFHDLGMSIHRANHEEFSLFLARNLIKETIDFLPIVERTIVTSEILHAIISHRRAGSPFTIEGGIVRVADALDMSSGRSRIPFRKGSVDINSLSALAIEKVEIREGNDEPIEVNVLMSNSAGIFQIDELLKEKLSDSGIEQYVKVKAYIERRTEKKLITEFSITSKNKD
jgi:metal-dependent HD superfamily phosphatase/phosphodiesterase